MSQLVKVQGMLVVGLLSLLCNVSSAHAASVIAGSIVRDMGPLAVAIQAVLIIVAAIVVGGLGINSAMEFRRGDMAGGVYGAFTTVFAGVVLFVIIPSIIGGNVAAASTLQ